MEFNDIGGAIRRENMDFLVFMDRFFYIVGEFVGGSGIGNAGFFTLFLQGRRCFNPDYVIDCGVMAEDGLCAVIGINDGGEGGGIEAEEIQE